MDQAILDFLKVVVIAYLSYYAFIGAVIAFTCYTVVKLIRKCIA